MTIHFVDNDSRARAEKARIAYASGHHAEVYSDLQELITIKPDNGVLMVTDRVIAGDPEHVMERLGEAGISLPLVVTSDQPAVQAVVRTMKAGALDYLKTPFDQDRFADVMHRLALEASSHMEARRKLIEARGRIAQLSKREREVLDWLAEGNSNKAIARALDISPRTVEIHRANMMDKLGTNHSAEAVRLRIEAQLEENAARQPKAEEAARSAPSMRRSNGAAFL
ncbi:response regulator transcription factor [Altericroceibacterium spongiae]|uniref:response regulator transcription factor n=1 Tax=Altericroceibacterium spongiae TaxID=2320269 RepID=UPI003082DCE0